MKYPILVTALIFSSLASADDRCLEVHDVARVVMLNRLDGISQYRQQNLAKDMLDGDELRVTSRVIKNAYEQPDSRDKAKAASWFAEAWMIRCARGEVF